MWLPQGLVFSTLKCQLDVATARLWRGDNYYQIDLSWVSRYFILQGHYLVYHDEKNKGTESRAPKGALNLDEVQVEIQDCSGFVLESFFFFARVSPCFSL